MKVYGPYLGKDGRLRVVIRIGKKNRTQSYPRYLIEQFVLGHKLNPSDDVHHKDENPLNNDPSNLVIVPHSEHISKHATKYPLSTTVICVWCGSGFELSRSSFHNRKRGKHGPFCSRRCSGQYGTSMQKTLKVSLNKGVK